MDFIISVSKKNLDVGVMETQMKFGLIFRPISSTI